MSFRKAVKKVLWKMGADDAADADKVTDLKGKGPIFGGRPVGGV
jgi:hypothetical protein